MCTVLGSTAIHFGLTELPLCRQAKLIAAAEAKGYVTPLISRRQSAGALVSNAGVSSASNLDDASSAVFSNAGTVPTPSINFAAAEHGHGDVEAYLTTADTIQRQSFSRGLLDHIRKNSGGKPDNVEMKTGSNIGGVA